MDALKPLKKLHFGTAGIPLSTPKSSKSGTAAGVEHVKKIGLSCMEMEFVRGVNIKEDKTPEIREIAKKNDILLSCHAPYYINLNSIEKEKQEASKKRIFDSAKISSLCGGRSVVFHAGYFQKMNKDQVYNTIKKNIKDILKKMQDENINIMLRPEVTGKETQFGSLTVLLKLSSELEGVLPCVDFAHLHARTAGMYNTADEFESVLEEIEKTLGKLAIKNMHMHMAGIDYGQKGEKKHLILKESDYNYKDLMKVFKEYKIAGTLICESPNIESDALLMKQVYDSI